MPIVPGAKSDVTVRIYGDYKVTINQAAKIDTYISSQELFASLSGECCSPRLI